MSAVHHLEEDEYPRSTIPKFSEILRDSIPYLYDSYTKTLLVLWYRFNAAEHKLAIFPSFKPHRVVF